MIGCHRFAEMEALRLRRRIGRSQQCALREGEGLTEALAERRAVCQVRQTIRAGKQGDFFLSRLALGDVDDDSFNFDEAPLRVCTGT